MSNNLPATVNDNKWTTRVMRALGPLISLSQEASEKYAEHQMRLAKVEVAKESMLLEVRMYADIKKQLVEEFVKAEQAERLHIRKKIKEIDQEVRKIGVYQQAVNVLETTPQETSPQLLLENNQQQEDAYTAWIDTFNDYAKKQNEPWRQDLLAKALAKEATHPGSIGQRALWFIGTIDERSFNAFAALLNVSISIAGSYVLPNQGEHLEKVVSTAVLGAEMKLGNVIFQINDLGLIGDLMSTQKIFQQEAILPISYGTSHALIQLKQELRISGVILTSLGDTIASMYKPQIDPLGSEIYAKWLETVKATPCTVLHES
jgi:hypothetical protein